MDPLVLVIAFVAGLAFKKVGYPPLPGYLIAGFAAHAAGIGDIEFITAVADIGITLLLFTIGLKLNVRELAAPQVWAVTGLHLAIAVPLTTLVIVLSGLVFPALALKSASSAWVLAFALSFSSTVFAVKMFEDRGETASLHANIAIGVLVFQDLIAVTFLVLTADTLPSIYALGLVALPLLRPVLRYILSVAGHGELVMLFGISVALGTAQLFEFLNLKAGLGALLIGIILGSTSATKELYQSLISLKDLFLIGFFLQIGFYGLPSTQMLFVAMALSLLIFLRPLIYYFLFVAFRLRARTALISGMSLFNYSEFGLIVAAIAVSLGILPTAWLTTLALAVSISFFIATPFNTTVHHIYNRYGEWLHRFERTERLPEEQPTDLGDAEVIVLGMGRVGRGVYHYMEQLYPGKVIGVEESYDKVAEHVADGLNCVHGDASDHDFWRDANVDKRKIIVVSLTNHTENITVVELARAFDFDGHLAVISRYPDEQAELEDMGCISFNLYREAGTGFAEHVHDRIAADPAEEKATPS